MIFSIKLTNVFSQVQIEPEDLLQMSLEKLMNLEVITASLTPQVAFDAPATVYVITEEQIKTRGYSNLEELLEDIPEIQVQNKTNATTYNFFSLRGIGGNEKFIILMDGIRINPTAGDPIHIGYNYSIANANRVEVILGPVSALYGADAYSGVINIITKHGNEIKKNKVVVSYGSFNASDNSCVVGLGNDDISLSLTGSYYHSSEADFPDIFKGDYDWYNKEYKTNGNVLTFSGDTQTLSNIEEYNIDKRAYFINGRFKLRNF